MISEECIRGTHEYCLRMIDVVRQFLIECERAKINDLPVGARLRDLTQLLTAQTPPPLHSEFVFMALRGLVPPYSVFSPSCPSAHEFVAKLLSSCALSAASQGESSRLIQQLDSSGLHRHLENERLSLLECPTGLLESMFVECPTGLLSLLLERDIRTVEKHFGAIKVKGKKSHLILKRHLEQVSQDRFNRAKAEEKGKGTGTWELEVDRLLHQLASTRTNLHQLAIAKTPVES